MCLTILNLHNELETKATEHKVSISKAIKSKIYHPTCINMELLHICLTLLLTYYHNNGLQPQQYPPSILEWKQTLH